ncbi:MAG: tetratricopeptide repeat protein [Rhodospirillaceae bacterium]|nr:tetratricopeptide repeat protein [Rhodospirillaceae bacterium]
MAIDWAERRKKDKEKKNRKKASKESPSLEIQQSLKLGLTHHQAGRLDQAEAIYRQILETLPDFADANHLLGVICHQKGDIETAIGLISKAIKASSGKAPFHSNLGNALKDQGRLEEAGASYRRALALRPDFPEALNNLGDALRGLEQFDEARACLHKVIALSPGMAEAHNNLGLTLHEGQGLLAEAEASYRKALTLNPNFPQAHNNLGNALSSLGQLDDAVASFQKAIALKPDYAEAHNNLGVAFQSLGRFDEAMTSYDEALAINPDYGEAHGNLGSARAAHGQLDNAMASYRRALEIEPELAYIHSNLIFYQDFIAGLDQAAQQEERRRWNEKFILPLTGKIKPHVNDRDPDRPLRIGYVSADFKNHSACQGFAPLIMDRDRDRFEVVCYDGNAVPDQTTEVLRGAATQWRSTIGISDAALAETIREDGIDILVDLSGHSEKNRLVLFGHKPAPVQATGIGHLAPGVSTIDYRLTSTSATPPGEAALYPEQPVYLNAVVGFRPPADAPPVSAPPGLASGAVTFGSLNRLEKVTDDVLALWAKILLDVADSRLLIKDPSLDVPVNRQRLQDFFGRQGITEARLVLLGKTAKRGHLEAYNRIDIALDPFPQGGGMSTLESLWMGTPVLGLHDSRKFAGRLIKLLCQPLGLQDWIAESTDEYHKMAVQWADQPAALAELSQGLRTRVSDIYGRFPHEVEAAYRIMWQRWCNHEPPSPLDLAGPA